LRTLIAQTKGQGDNDAPLAATVAACAEAAGRAAVGSFLALVVVADTIAASGIGWRQ
jgi:hypothetical protein